MTTYEDRAAARRALMLDLAEEGERHRREMRRIELMRIRAVMGRLGEAERLEADGFVFAAREFRAGDHVPAAGPVVAEGGASFAEQLERIERDRREHQARRARAARERGMAERLAAASGRAWPA